MFVLRFESDYRSGAERSSAAVNLDFLANLRLRGGGWTMCKMIAFVPQLHRGEKPESAEPEPRTTRQFRGDGCSSVAVSGAPVPGPGRARAGLPDGRFARGVAGSSAGQAEAAAGVPPRSFPHPDHREHHVSGHRAARLPEEAERSSRAGKPSASVAPFLFSFSSAN